MSVSETKARAAYERACEALGVSPHSETVVQGGSVTWPSGPVLCSRFDESDRYAIVWDGGADWTDADGSPWHLVASSAASNDEVYAEPMNHWAVSLYPAHA